MLLHSSYLLAILAAFLSALGALLIKRSFFGGIGAFHGILIGNWLFALFIAPSWLWSSQKIPIELWWLPLLGGSALTVGAYSNYFALHKGDVSIATPLLGLKTVFVALISTLILKQAIPISWWIASLLSLVALSFFTIKNSSRKSSHLLQTILLSVLSALSFAIIDILIQHYADAFNFLHFLLLSQCVLCIFSSILVWIKKPETGTLNFETIGWLALATFFIAAGFMILGGAIAHFKDAVPINVVFSARGLFSVLMVWILGPLINNFERRAGARILVFRLLGAGLLVVAITLLSFEEAP